MCEERILYEDNHLIALNKAPGELVQGDRSGDPCLLDLLKEFIKKRDRKPGKVFLGLPHRLDRPTSGVVVFAKTGKALGRMGELFKERRVRKIYWAVVDKMPPSDEGRLVHYLRRIPKLNKSVTVPESEAQRQGAKMAALRYRVLAAGDRYYLLEIELETGRHHQIRAQLAAVGCHIKGDLKYGAKRSNKDGGIHLHARSLSFIHPVRRTELILTAEPPKEPLWDALVSEQRR
ncbi:MAG TPA: RNA pseudouridine synthase [Sediminispirochaeta sp.]|nr:RNA pseudouridine synthase [Sediminispirochaeta sp.]